jgi:hypothetical protein
MCIAIAKQAGVEIDPVILERCFTHNPDGAGFCIEQDGVLQIHKGLFTFKAFYDAFKPFENQKALIHFRIKTHGPLNTENCHPFFVNDECAFIHNGIISGVPNSRTESDTIMFNNLYIKPLVKDYGYAALKTTPIKKLIEDFIGHSKLAFFNKNEDDFLIFNKEKGNLSAEGIWFSNESWKEREVVVYAPHTYTPKKHSSVRTTPLWGSKTLVDIVPEVVYLNEPFKKNSVVESLYVIVDGFGTVPKWSTGLVSECYSNGRVDVNFDLYGKISNIHPAQLVLLSPEECPLNMNTWGDA